MHLARKECGGTEFPFLKNNISHLQKVNLKKSVCESLIIFILLCLNESSEKVSNFKEVS